MFLVILLIAFASAMTLHEEAEYKKYVEMRNELSGLQRRSEHGDLGARMEVNKVLKSLEFGLLHGQFADKHAVEHHPAKHLVKHAAPAPHPVVRHAPSPVRHVTPAVRHIPARYVPHTPVLRRHVPQPPRRR